MKNNDRKISLRYKIFVSLILIVVILSFVFGLITKDRWFSSIKKNYKEKYQLLTDFVSRDIKKLSSFDSNKISSLIKEYDKEKVVTNLQIVDEQGHELYSTIIRQNDSAKQMSFKKKISYRNNFSTIILGFSQSELDKELKEYNLLFIISTIGFILIILLSVYYLINKLFLKDFEKLTKSFINLSKGDISVSDRAINKSDEFGDLSEALKQLSVKLRSFYDQFETYREQIRLTEANFKRLFDFAPVAIVIVDKENNIIAYNQFFLKFIKLSENELKRYKLDDFFLNPDKDKPAILKQLMDTNQVYNYELKFKNGEGKDCVVLFSQQGIIYNNRACIETVIKDVTEVKDLEARMDDDVNKLKLIIEEQKKEIERISKDLTQASRLAAIGEVSGQTAHEVLNPLTTVNGRVSRMIDSLSDEFKNYLETFNTIIDAWNEDYQSGGFDKLFSNLKQVIDDNEYHAIDDDLSNLEALKDYLNKYFDKRMSDYTFISKEIFRIVKIVDKMRGLGRISSTIEKTSLSEIIFDVIEIFLDSLPKRNIELKTDIEDENIYINVDKNEMMQVFINIIRNALEAIEHFRGRSGGFINIKVSKNAELTEIRISDNGGGIKKEHIPYIMESSFTTKDPSKGTGVGLSLCKRFVNNYDGEIIVEDSTIGKGTTFLITLPISNP